MTDTATELQSQGAYFDSAPSVNMPVPPPEIHQGVITGVLWTPNTNSLGGRFVIGLASTDNGIETDYSFFLPLPFVKDIHAPLEAYSSDKPYYEESGNYGLSEVEQYGRLIKNNSNSAVLQTLVNLAIAQGRMPSNEQPTDIEGLAGQLNDLLANVKVVFTRSADKKPRDSQYAGVLRVRKVVGPLDTISARTLKYYQNPKNGYYVAWAQ